MNQEQAAFKRSLSRRRQQSLKLASRPDFQQDIAEIREKWHIPFGGFGEANQDGIGNWWHWLGEQDEKWHMGDWQAYREELIQFEKDALAQKRSYKDYVDRQAAINLTKPINNFYEDIRKIQIKYKLGPTWRDGLRSYLFINDPARIRRYIGVRLQTSLQDDPTKEELHIIVEDDTTLEDIKAAWPNIKYHQQQLSYRTRQKQQPIDQEILDRGAYAYSLRAIEKRPLKQVAELLNKRYDTSYTYSDVPTIIKNYKKIVGMN